jgi:hypothetical protein
LRTQQSGYRLPVKSSMAALFLSLALLLPGAPAAAVDRAALPDGLVTCAADEVVVDQGYRGDCARALQQFLHFTVDFRGYGPICENIDIGFGEQIRITGIMNEQSARYLKCYQVYVRSRVEDPDDRLGYDDRLRIDGVAQTTDFVVMVQDTCANDDQFISASDEGRFGDRWFCTR